MTRAERGVVGGVEVLPFGLLIFVAGTLVILNGFAVVNAKLAVDDAAREGARTAIDTSGAGPTAPLATLAARRAFAGTGLPEPGLAVAVEEPGSGRCGVIVVTASYAVPTLGVPFIAAFRHPVTVRSTYREHAERFASGRTGDATCAG